MRTVSESEQTRARKGWGITGLVAILGAVAGVGCGDTQNPEKPQPTGTIRTALSTGSVVPPDVKKVQYDIVAANQPCGSTPIVRKTVALETEPLPPSLLPDGGGTHAFSDALFVLSPGEYRVCATPLDGNGNASSTCGLAQALVQVVANTTGEVVLVSECKSTPTGGIDIVDVFNLPPVIADLVITPSKFIAQCQRATLKVLASDPNGDALSYTWGVVAAPAGAHPSIVGSGAEVQFSTDVIGDYMVKVTVTDVYGASTSLSFPIHVSATTSPNLPGAPCTVGAGQCQKTGVFVCQPASDDPVCGVTPGTANPEVCNGIDDDCDGKVDEDLGSTTCGSGGCAVTVPACENGQPKTCTPTEPEVVVWEEEGCNKCDGRAGCSESCMNTPGDCSASGLLKAWCYRRNPEYSYEERTKSIWYQWIFDYVAARCTTTPVLRTDGAAHKYHQDDYWICSNTTTCKTYVGVTPLVLLFDDQPLSFTAAFGTGRFDLAAIGRGQRFDTPSAPWLALDADGNGAIDSGAELFGSGTALGTGIKAKNGFEALAVLDDNGDGVVDEHDRAFSRLSVWRDDGNWQTDAGEMRSLSALGVLSLSLRYESRPECDARGNCAIERASFSYRDAAGGIRQGRIVDVHLLPR